MSAKKVNILLKKPVKRDAGFVQTDQEHGVRYVRLGFVWNFKAFHKN